MDLPVFINKTDKTPIYGRFPPVSSRPSGLPSDVLREGSNRVGLAALIYAFVFFSAYFIADLRTWVERIQGGTLTEAFDLGATVAVISILLSLGFFCLSVALRARPRLLLDLSLAFEVVAAFGIAMAEYWGSWSRWFPDRSELGPVGLSWTCVWIVAFPYLAPNKPRKVLIASLLAASAGPVTIILSHHLAAGTCREAMTFFLARVFPFTTYLCAILAFVASRGIHGLGTRLKKARDIGSYRLVKLLGRGGMGEVWWAEHHMLARPAAIKLIRPEILGADEGERRSILRRFEREAQATAILRSYHTIDLYDFGVTSDGSFYYAMELLNGLDLDSLVRRFGPVSAERAIHFLRQACHSLAEAHYTGLIHRDIKPTNLYSCRLGLECDFIKVLDFGLVKPDRTLRHETTPLTRPGITCGSPGYMAPEMALGKTEIDERTDIYALGCVAYWLLTGQLVFEGQSPLAMIVQHVQSAPVPPSKRTEIEIPAALEGVILSCLEKDPANRPQTAAELGHLLANCKTKGSWTTGRMKAWWDLHMPRREADPESHAGETPSGQAVLHPRL